MPCVESSQWQVFYEKCKEVPGNEAPLIPTHPHQHSPEPVAACTQRCRLMGTGGNQQRSQRMVLHVCHKGLVTHTSMDAQRERQDASPGLQNDMHHYNLADKGAQVRIARQCYRPCSTCCTSNTRGAELVVVQTNGGKVHKHTTCLQRAALAHQVHVLMKQHGQVGLSIAGRARAGRCRGAESSSMRT